MADRSSDSQFSKQRAQILHRMMEAMVESSDDAMILLDGHGRIVAANLNFMQLYGLQGTQVVGRQLEEIKGPLKCCFAREAAFQAFYSDLFRQDAGEIRREVQLDLPSRKTILLCSIPVAYQEGHPLGCLSVHTVIAGGSRSSDSFKEVADFSEACPFPILRCDKQGKALYLNPASSLLLKQVRLEPDQWTQLLPQGSWTQIWTQLGDHRAAFDLKGDFRGRSFEFTLMPHKAEDELFVMINDLTEQLEAQTKLVDYARELETMNRQIQEAQDHLIQSEKMASLGLLVAGIAHEINTPIGSIHSNNDILIRTVSKLREFFEHEGCPLEVRDNPEVIKIMKVLEEVNQNNHLACDRIVGIISSLKNFSRLDSAEKKKANLHEGLDSTLTLVHHHLKNRIQVVKEYGDVPEVSCFPNRLNQVFMNILVNAAQAMPEKGVLTIKTTREASNAKVVITDTGGGIPPKDLTRIFNPGFTTKREGVGTGLGLSICQKIMEDHHGRIDVTSKVGKGTTFTLTLPID